jgi:hypothetical protein
MKYLAEKKLVEMEVAGRNETYILYPRHFE